MKLLQAKVIIITDGENYFIHGVSGETPVAMFETMRPLWKVDPSKETIHCLDLEISIPELEKLSDDNDTA